MTRHVPEFSPYRPEVQTLFWAVVGECRSDGAALAQAYADLLSATLLVAGSVDIGEEQVRAHVAAVAPRSAEGLQAIMARAREVIAAGLLEGREG